MSHLLLPRHYARTTSCLQFSAPGQYPSMIETPYSVLSAGAIPLDAVDSNY